MDFQKLTIKAQNAVATAQEIASNYDNQALEIIHLFAALIQDSAGVSSDLIQKQGTNLNHLKIKINEELEKMPKVAGGSGQYMSPQLSTLIDNSIKIAKTMHDEYVSTEHLLIAILESSSNAGKILKEQGITSDGLKQAVVQIRGGRAVTDQNQEETYNALRKYGIMLNEVAKEGKIDPVIGRQEEIRRVLQVLSRRTKNNPILMVSPVWAKQLLLKG